VIIRGPDFAQQQIFWGGGGLGFRKLHATKTCRNIAVEISSARKPVSMKIEKIFGKAIWYPLLCKQSHALFMALPIYVILKSKLLDVKIMGYLLNNESIFRVKEFNHTYHAIIMISTSLAL